MKLSHSKTAAVICLLIISLILPVFATNAFAIFAGIKFHKNNLMSLDDVNQLKTFIPAKHKGFLDACFNARIAGQDAYYTASVWVDVWGEDPAVTAVSFQNPSGKTFKLVRTDDESFESLPGDEDKNYFSINEFKQDFPSGVYTFTLTRSDKTTFTSVATLPDYDAGDFPQFVDLNCSAAPGGVLNLNWSTVAGNDNYDIWAVNLNTFKDVVELEDQYYSHPQTIDTTLTGTVAGKNDYEAGVEVEQQFASSGDTSFIFKSDSSKFIFKTSFSLIKQCSVKAGKTSDLPDDSILLAGQLNATDTNINNASEIKVTVSAPPDMTPYVEVFPKDAVSWKNGKFISSRAVGASSSKFTFDAKTHKFSLLAKNVNLTGLWCPFTLKVEIGDYTAEMTVDETIANGPSKSVPIQLMQSVRDVLQVTSFKPKFGKTDYSDTLTIKGVFTVKGDPNKANPLVVNLGAHSFTVEGGNFMKKGFVESCKADSIEGASVVSSFDFSKCAFSIVVKNANITDFGLVDFNLDIFGNPLSNSNQLDLGPQRVFALEDLRMYDTPGALWIYDADFTYTVKAAGTSGKYSDSATATITVADTVIDGKPGYQVTTSTSGSNAYSYWFSDSYGVHWAGMSMPLNVIDYSVESDLVFPQSMAIGRTYTSSAPFFGKIGLNIDDYVPDDTTISFDFSNFNGTASNTFKLLKKEPIDVFGSTYEAVKCSYSAVIKGTIDVYVYFEDDVDWYELDTTASFTTTASQTFWAVPGIGIVYADTKMNTTLSIKKLGSVGVAVTENDTLIDYALP